MKRAAERGSAFETTVGELLRAAGFRVTRNAGAARPRQTDFYAQGEELDLLVEAKDRERKVDVGDIDALRSRLRHTSADVVGAIFTTSELTRGAVQAIEMDRTREVLAFVKEEIELLRSGRQNLRTLIQRKRAELRTQGRAWFGPVSRAEFIGVKLPSGHAEFRIGDTRRSFFESRTGFAHGSYTLNIPDSGWGILGGEGSSLTLRLTLSTAQDLRNILGYLHDRFGLSNTGTFSIHQSEVCWNGVGAENFVQAAAGWHERYALSQAKSWHHSEELHYFDNFRSGWLILSTQQRISWSTKSADPSFLHQPELAIQLPGVPVDMAPFLELCRYTDNEWANFENVGERLTHKRRLKKSIALDVVGAVITTVGFDHGALEQDRVVIGVIARNPFFGQRPLPKELRCEEMLPLRELHTIELLLCSLRDWHDDGDMIDKYKLEGFDVTCAGRTQMIRPFGTWNHIVKRARIERRRATSAKLIDEDLLGLSLDDDWRAAE